jgi:uptake hydrogenase large subunit
MSVAPLPEGISIDLRVARGCVEQASVRAGGRSPAEILFRGRDGATVPKLAASVFALCPMAQSTAAGQAIAAAADRTFVATPTQATQLLAERIAENLRSIVLTWPGEAPNAEALGSLRGALAALRATHDAPRAEALSQIAKLRAHARALGFPPSPGEPLGAGWVGRIWRNAAADEMLTALRAPRPLANADDDEAMFDALDGIAPTLPPQPARDLDFSEHLRARFDGLAQSIADLAAFVGDERPDAGARTRRSKPAIGIAAVDSPRGRLYHRAVLDDRGQVHDYRIVSPTDRNFGAEGSFAQALAGAKLGAGPRAQRRAERLAALYDPCVAFRIHVTEAIDA